MPSHPCTVEGHRGALYLGVENTVDAFRAAYEAGADSVELDVFLLRDGELAVFHGGSGGELSRLTHTKGKITEFTLEEVKQIKFDPSSENIMVGSDKSEVASIPSLEECLQVVKEKEGRRVTVELKGPDTAEGSLALVKKMGLLPVTTFSSFKHHEIARVKELDPTAITAALFEIKLEAKELIEDAKKVNANQIHYRYDYLSKELVDELHGAGYSVMGWMRGPTSMGNEESLDLYQKVMGYGIDTICVNHPEWISKNIK